MYIQTLKMENFRGAKDLSLELNERLNVFVGMNGAGKSSTLDATTILLSWLVNRIKNLSASGKPITEADIYNEKSTSSLSVSCRLKDRIFNWNIAKTRKGYSKKDISSNLVDATESAKRIQIDISETNSQVNIPLIAYYPVNRAVLDIPLRIRNRHSFELLTAYEKALSGGADFRTFFEWFREREDLENEARRNLDRKQLPIFYDESEKNRIKESKNHFPDPQLDAVRTALNRFMPEFNDLSVHRNPLRMEVEKNGKRMTVNQLSDGEKCLMAMIGDLARRMAIANPVGEKPLEGSGIILIDEIDLHLHPKWQRMIVPGLTKVFPNCQFLITTHSPHVITHVHPENLFLLRMTDEGLISDRASESYGKTEDWMELYSTVSDDASLGKQD